MPLSLYCLKFKQNLAEKCSITLLWFVTMNLVSGILFSERGSKELYKSNTFTIDQCQIKSIDLKFVSGSLYPRWNITVVYNNQTINHSLLSSNGFQSESKAWDHAHKYQINSTYICYHSRNDPSISRWTWQWKKPSILKGCLHLFGGVLLIVIATVLLILKLFYRLEFLYIQRQRRHQPMQMSLINEE